jgi:hypothetical protein
MGARALHIAIAIISVGLGASVSMAGPPTTLDDVVVLARDALTTSQDVLLTSGHLVVHEPAGILSLRPSFSALSGTQIVANTIDVRGGSGGGPVLYDVFVNSYDPLAIYDSQALRDDNVLGEGPTIVGFPLPFAFPSPPVVTPGTDDCPIPGRVDGDCLVRVTTPQTLPPGNYGKIRVAGRAALYFAGGTYNVRSIRTGGQARLLFNAPTTLLIAERAEFGQRAELLPNAPDLNPRCINIEIAASEHAVKFGGNSTVQAMISAPDAEMKLRANGEYTGRFVAKTVAVGVGSQLGAAPLLTGACE